MIKGINKQIIEIKCTNNEHFEKILLFVKGNSCSVPKDILTSYGESLVQNAANNSARKKAERKGRIVACTAVAVAIVLTVFMVKAMI